MKGGSLNLHHQSGYQQTWETEWGTWTHPCPSSPLTPFQDSVPSPPNSNQRAETFRREGAGERDSSHVNSKFWTDALATDV